MSATGVGMEITSGLPDIINSKSNENQKLLVANILICSNNPQLIAQCTHALIGLHSVSRMLNPAGDWLADMAILDARKLDDDASIVSAIAHKRVRFIVLGESWGDEKQINVLLHGAAGYCETADVSDLLERAVASVLNGDIWIRRGLVPKVIGELTKRHCDVSAISTSSVDIDALRKQIETLSAREVEVADMIRQGENNKRIACALNISERTVKAHLSSIFRKLEVDDRLRLAIRLKEIDQFR
jgi:two-component system, NarL family, nitrate/nitrite response regulator NarL